MSTDLAVIEAALGNLASPLPWAHEPHPMGDWVHDRDFCSLALTDASFTEGSAPTYEPADAHLIANAPAWLAELVERVKAAEAERREAALITGGIVRKRNEARRRAETAESTIARVRELAEQHPGTAWNSGLNLRQALRDALAGTPTDAPEGAKLADDERNRFSGEDTGGGTEPILQPTDQRYEPPAVDDESGCCRG